MKKIQTHNKHQYNKKRKFANFPVIEFDKNGVATVEDDVAKYITRNHDMITLEGEELSTKESPQSALDTNGDLHDLKSKLEELSNKLIHKEIEIGTIKRDKDIAEEDLKAYKGLVDDLRAEIVSLKQVIDTVQTKSIPDGAKKEVEDVKEDPMFTELMEQTKNELLKACGDMGYPKGEWNGFKSNNVVKKTVANYLISKLD